MVTRLSITRPPPVKTIVPVTAKAIVSPSLASTSACRSEPGPLSFVLMTAIVAACAGIANTQRNSAPIIAEWSVLRIYASDLPERYKFCVPSRAKRRGASCFSVLRIWPVMLEARTWAPSVS